MNPLFTQNNQSNNFLSMLANCNGNPQKLVQQMVQSNPQFASFIKGKNPQELAKQLCEQKGVTPEEVLNSLGIKK